MDVQDLTLRLAISNKALDANLAETFRKAAQAALDGAYEAWKAKRGIDQVERDTPQWDKMMKATKPQYKVLVEAKRDEKNAKRRLATAIDRYWSR
ncbi:hypothetical protein [Xanthobacter agilis]|uniref:Uncharacterized protein n=1 Tax=Xanthobacter agilis TaxID=47492 RepID=A0ABU0LFT6_XANAG|nr:hypothetical protein [Xanthobacter agilis]MDQ0505973.1 hypothetical protein [Xanthobacter agilis]